MNAAVKKVIRGKVKGGADGGQAAGYDVDQTGVPHHAKHAAVKGELEHDAGDTADGVFDCRHILGQVTIEGDAHEQEDGVNQIHIQVEAFCGEVINNVGESEQGQQVAQEAAVADALTDTGASQVNLRRMQIRGVQDGDSLRS